MSVHTAFGNLEKASIPFLPLRPFVCVARLLVCMCVCVCVCVYGVN